jgi:hypothetical protein
MLNKHMSLPAITNEVMIGGIVLQMLLAVVVLAKRACLRQPLPRY